MAKEVAGLALAPPHVSFEEFFDAEHGSLYGALYLLTGGREESEDLMQFAFLKVWERWDRVRTLDRPAGYLYRTALNGFRSQRRRAIVASRRFARTLARADPIAGIELQDEVDRALAELTPRQRAAVVLVDLLQLGADEAAEILGIAQSTLRVLLARGRDRVRRSLRGME